MSLKERRGRDSLGSVAPSLFSQDHVCEHTDRILHSPKNVESSLSAKEIRHLETCPFCATEFLVRKAGSALADLPPRWTIHLGGTPHLFTVEDGATRQVLGSISFETREFSSRREEDWQPSPLGMRVNVVLDPEVEFFSLSLCDVPIAIESVSVITAHGLRPLRRDESGNTLEVTLWSDDVDDEECDDLRFSDIHSLLEARKLQLSVSMKATSEDVKEVVLANDFLDLLEQHEAIERTDDYVLPSGLHSDTYVNIAALCTDEDSLQFTAAKTDFLLWDVQFDTVLASGWAMGLIGRRLVANRQAQGRKTPMRQALCEGYSEPVLLDDIIPGSRVVILLDVMITGRLAMELQRLVRAAGADVVGIAVLVRSHTSQLPPGLHVRTLCEIEMHLVDTRQSTCPRCQSLAQKKVFNPIAGCMVAKSTAYRSPSQFLSEDASARELWEVVHIANAYEHHRREGHTHYVGFVDTRKLLESPATGKLLVEKLAHAVRTSPTRPTVLLVPHRSRARLLGSMLVTEFGEEPDHRVQLISATRHSHSGTWGLSSEDWGVVDGSHVLIVDTAAGHGRTIDQLATLATSARARSVGAAVLLSRLTPPCEESFNARLAGGFIRLFNLPIRPVAIRGDRVDLCPVCQRKNAIRRFAKASDIEALEHWAEGLLQARRGAANRNSSPAVRQLRLFLDEQPFLSACGAAVASGVTLHALGAASGHGNATLSLPELFDERIPWRVRATMVENLPLGILDWTGMSLVEELGRVLAEVRYPSIWKAAANLLSREGNSLWLDYLGSMLGRLNAAQQRTSTSFWNHMACNAFLLAATGTVMRDEVRTRIATLRDTGGDEVVQRGIEQMLEVVRDG